MQNAGIIVELNPYHAGHLWLLTRVRKQNPDILTVITTGWFSQRALPSLVTPDQKKEWLLSNGVDVVLDLPVIYGSQSADHFARAAIQSLKAAGVTDLWFGSETSDMGFLEEAADRLELIERRMDTSLVRQTADITGHLGSNDILAIQYIRWCRIYGITPHCIQREGRFESATSLRRRIENQDSWTWQMMSAPVSWKNAWSYLRPFLQFSSREQLESFFLVDHGMGVHMKKMAEEVEYHDFISGMITRTWTRARIQRSLLFSLLQVEWKEADSCRDLECCIVRGASEKGRTWLRTIPPERKISRARDLPELIRITERKARLAWKEVFYGPKK